MRYRLMCSAILVGLLAVVGGGAERTAAQGRPEPPKTLRMYVFDCGVLKIADPMPLFGLKKEEVGATDLSDAAYLIVHPRGTLMWEAGLVPDSSIGGANARPGAPTRKLKDLMADVGYKPADVTYFAISHGHGDHTANANDFQASTWLVNKAEHEAMFAEKAPRFYTPATYSMLKTSMTKFIDGDYDVFGDGSVVMKLAAGHTVGHQVLFLRLPKTGNVVLSGDLYHYPEERTLNRIPTFEVDEAKTRASRADIDAFVARNRAQLWVQHDIAAYAKLKKAPAFYD